MNLHSLTLFIHFRNHDFVVNWSIWAINKTVKQYLPLLCGIFTEGKASTCMTNLSKIIKFSTKRGKERIMSQMTGFKIFRILRNFYYTAHSDR